MASAGSISLNRESTPAEEEILASIRRLSAWLEKNNYSGYDTFDGLNSRLLRPLTFNSALLRIGAASRESGDSRSISARSRALPKALRPREWGLSPADFCACTRQPARACGARKRNSRSNG